MPFNPRYTKNWPSIATTKGSKVLLPQFLHPLCNNSGCKLLLYIVIYSWLGMCFTVFIHHQTVSKLNNCVNLPIRLITALRCLIYFKETSMDTSKEELLSFFAIDIPRQRCQICYFINQSEIKFWHQKLSFIGFFHLTFPILWKLLN